MVGVGTNDLGRRHSAGLRYQWARKAALRGSEVPVPYGKTPNSEGLRFGTGARTGPPAGYGTLGVRGTANNRQGQSGIPPPAGTQRV